MRAQAFEPSLDEAWNAFNRAARNGHLIFDRSFMTYHADRFADASLVFADRGQIAGLLPANREGDTVYSHKGLTFGGLVLGGARTTEVGAMLDAALEHWRARGVRSVVYKPVPWIYQRRPAQEDLYWLFRHGAVLQSRQTTAAIDLRFPGPVSQRRRRGVARAAAAGTQCARSTRFAEFWTVLSEVLDQRHGATAVHTPEEIECLSERFPENILLHTATNPGGEIVAGVVLFASGRVAHAQYIAATDEGRKTGALDLLFLRLIEEAQGRFDFFDFGTSNEQNGQVLNEGLIRHKEEFGASVAVHDVYALTVTP